MCEMSISVSGLYISLSFDFMCYFVYGTRCIDARDFILWFLYQSMISLTINICPVLIHEKETVYDNETGFDYITCTCVYSMYNIRHRERCN